LTCCFVALIIKRCSTPTSTARSASESVIVARKSPNKNPNIVPKVSQQVTKTRPNMSLKPCEANSLLLVYLVGTKYGHRAAKDSSKRQQDDPRLAQDGLKMIQDGSTIIPR
jgi:hypothetical protein